MMASQYKLIYFNGRGRAEVARLIMAYADIEYEDVRIEQENWPEMKPKMPFGQLPVLDVDGELIAQSGAIERLLGTKAGLMGSDDMETARINVVLCALEDYIMPLSAIYHQEDEERKKELKEKYFAGVPAETAKLESLVKGDYFLGSMMTVADITAFVILDYAAYMGSALNFDEYPKLKAMKENVASNEKMAAWIAKRPVTGF